MSGLFTRLSRQAIGQPRNPVCAAVQMPYQTSHDPFTAAQGDSASNPAPGIVENYTGNGRDITPPPWRLVQPTSSHEAKPETDPGVEKERILPVDPDANGVVAEKPLASEASGSIGKSVFQKSGELTRAETKDVASTQVDEPKKQVFDHPGPDASQWPSSTSETDREFVALSSNEFPQPRGSTHRPQPPPVESTQTESPAPQPLLPSVAETSATNSMTVPQTPPNTPESPNEVHVHIGRIEVTALQPAAGAKAKPRAARQPMSLDDYLARRRQN